MATLVEALSKPQFFKVLLPTSLQKLLIPSEFNKHIIKDGLEKATMLSPYRKTSWYIKIQKEAECFYFEEGWQEFVKAHSLKIGYMITFRYEGYEIFTFTAFEFTACQVDFTDDRLNQKQKKSKIDHKKCRRNEGDAATSKCFKRKEEQIELKKNTLHDKNVCSEMPNCIERTLHQYNIKGGQMGIPKTFCDLNELTAVDCLVLKDPRGRQWNVSVGHWYGGGLRLGKGFRDFAKVNNLKREIVVCSRWSSPNRRELF